LQIQARNDHGFTKVFGDAFEFDRCHVISHSEIFDTTGHCF
jgi:hypothetical protein